MSQQKSDDVCGDVAHTEGLAQPVFDMTTPGKLLLSWLHYLPRFFFRALGSGSLVSYVGGECWPSAV